VLLALVLGACGGGETTLFEPLDPTIRASVHTIAAPEGAAGTTTTMHVPLSVNKALGFDASFSYQLRAGTAEAGSAYVDQAGTVVLPSGALQTSIPVSLIGDDVEEPTQQFTIEVQSLNNIPMTVATASLFVANDDTACVAPAAGQPNRWLEDDRKNLNYAHRGGVIDFPENTLYAYKKVAAAGADVLEMDVYETADGELVILHDLDVDRTTNGTGLVGEKTLAEIRELDAAYWFVTGQGTPHDAASADYEFRGIATGQKAPPAGFVAADFRIPTLEEALQAFPDKLINVELKPELDGTGNYEAEVAALLRKYGRFDDVIVASFVDEAMQNFKAEAPCFPTTVPLGQAQSLVVASFGDNPMPPAPEHVALQVPPDTSQIQQIPFFLRIVSADLLQDAHNAGLALHVWTINDCEEMLEMLDLGVDAIMTDRPLLLERVLEQPEGARSCENLE
jgi:glycerophosphoryl diester phosphodiesterase